jgi:hypothetical protein
VLGPHPNHTCRITQPHRRRERLLLLGLLLRLLWPGSRRRRTRASPPERRARRGARSGGVGVRPPRAGQRGPGTYRSKMRQQLSLPDVRLAPIPTPNSIGFGPLRPSPPHAVAEAPLPRQPRILAQQPEPRIGAPWRIRGIGRSEPTPISARAGSNL